MELKLHVQLDRLLQRPVVGCSLLILHILTFKIKTMDGSLRQQIEVSRIASGFSTLSHERTRSLQMSATTMTTTMMMMITPTQRCFGLGVSSCLIVSHDAISSLIIRMSILPAEHSSPPVGVCGAGVCLRKIDLRNSLGAPDILRQSC